MEENNSTSPATHRKKSLKNAKTRSKGTRGRSQTTGKSPGRSRSSSRGRVTRSISQQPSGVKTKSKNISRSSNIPFPSSSAKKNIKSSPISRIRRKSRKTTTTTTTTTTTSNTTITTTNVITTDTTNNRPKTCTCTCTCIMSTIPIVKALSSPLREGYVQRLKKNTKEWMKEYCVLIGSKLLFYHEKTDHKITLEIFLEGAKVDIEPKSAYGEAYTFSIQPADDPIVMISATSEDDIEDWISDIRKQAEITSQGNISTSSIKQTQKNTDSRAIDHSLSPMVLAVLNSSNKINITQSTINSKKIDQLSERMEGMMVKVSAIYDIIEKSNSKSLPVHYEEESTTIQQSIPKKLETQKSKLISSQEMKSSKKLSRIQLIQNLRKQQELMKKQLLLQTKVIERQQTLLEQQEKLLLHGHAEDITITMAQPKLSISVSENEPRSAMRKPSIEVKSVRRPSQHVRNHTLPVNFETLAKKSEQSPEKALKKKKVMEEIISSEELYVGFLNSIVKDYVVPLKDILTQTQVKAIFANVEQLLGIHKAMLRELNETQNVASTFIKYAQFLKCYTGYVNNYEKCLAMQTELKDHKTYQAFITRVKQLNSGKRGLGMSSLLIMPIQRIPRYSLLLSELLKFTDVNSVEGKTLAEALAKVKEIATFVNKKKSDVDAMAKVVDIQNRLTNTKTTIVKPGRILIHEFTGLTNIKDKPYKFYLFSDIIMWTSISDKFKGTLNLSGISFSSRRDKNIQSFTLTEESTQKTLEFCYTNHNEQSKWLNRLEKAIEDAKKDREEKRRRRMRSTNASRSELREKLALSAMKLKKNSLKLKTTDVSQSSSDESLARFRQKYSSSTMSISGAPSHNRKRYSNSVSWIESENSDKNKIDDELRNSSFFSPQSTTQTRIPERNFSLKRSGSADVPIGYEKSTRGGSLVPDNTNRTSMLDTRWRGRSTPRSIGNLNKSFSLSNMTGQRGSVVYNNP